MTQFIQLDALPPSAPLLTPKKVLSAHHTDHHQYVDFPVWLFFFFFTLKVCNCIILLKHGGAQIYVKVAS